MSSVYQEISSENEPSSSCQSLTARLEFPRKWLHLGEKIGKGAFGDVFIGTVSGSDWRMLEGKKVAVKVLKGTSFHYCLL